MLYVNYLDFKNTGKKNQLVESIQFTVKDSISKFIFRKKDMSVKLILLQPNSSKTKFGLTKFSVTTGYILRLS